MTTPLRQRYIPTPIYAARPPAQNLKAWTYDPVLTSGNGGLTLGAIHLIAIPIPTSVTVSNLLVCIQAAGATLTAGQCLLGLYSATGTRLALSSDQAAVWTSVGFKTAAVTPVAISGGTTGTVYAAWLCNGTTSPQFYRSNGLTTNTALMVNAGLSSAPYRCMFTTTTTYTTLPTTLDLTTDMSVMPSNFWMGLS